MLVSNFFKNKYLFSLLVLLSISVFAVKVQKKEITEDFPYDKFFCPGNEKTPRLQGKISEGRYEAPLAIFSCQAHDFGEGKYTAQDALLDQIACVGFYNATADFKKAEIIFVPGHENKPFQEKDLRHTFENFGIEILKKVDEAQGIEILKEEMLEGGMFFAAISIQKLSFLVFPNGEQAPVTRGYLIFLDKDKLVVLSNQLVTLPGQKHNPNKHVERLKREILEFRNTFEFGTIPDFVIEKIVSKASNSP